MKKLTMLLAVLFVVAVSGAAFAQPFTAGMSADIYDSTPDAIPTPNENNDNLSGVPNPADINDAINLLLGTSYAHNSDVDSLRYLGNDNTWIDIAGASSTGGVALISLTAANANTLRVYDVANPSTKLFVMGPDSGFGYTGDGSIANPFEAASIPLASGTNFGFSLKSVGSTTNIWDSNAAVNAGGYDHMLTYDLGALAGHSIYIETSKGTELVSLNHPYLITWEDKPYNPTTHKLGDEDFDDAIYLVDRVIPIPEPMSLMLLGSGLLGLIGLRRKVVC